MHLWSVAVECKAMFMRDSFPSDVPVVIKVFVRSLSETVNIL